MSVRERQDRNIVNKFISKWHTSMKGFCSFASELILASFVSCFVQPIIHELRCWALLLGGNNCCHKLGGMSLKLVLSSRCLLLVCSVTTKPYHYSSALSRGPPTMWLFRPQPSCVCFGTAKIDIIEASWCPNTAGRSVSPTFIASPVLVEPHCSQNADFRLRCS